MSSETILLTLSGGLDLGLQESQDEAKKHAIDVEMQEQRIAADQQTLKRNDQLNRIMSTQQAQIGARGISPDSASLQALNLDQFNELAKDQSSINLGLDERLNDLNIKKENIDNSTLAGIAQNLFDLERFSGNVNF